MDQENEIAEVAPKNGEAKPAEVSASTIGRMMGLVTNTEFRLLEGKVDLLTTKVATMTMKMDKILGILGSAPTGADLERIDVQIGGLKTLIKDVLDNVPGSGAA